MMNDKLISILEKHGIYISDKDIKAQLNKAIIEICYVQKIECAKLFEYHYQKKEILNSKNIAE